MTSRGRGCEGSVAVVVLLVVPLTFLIAGFILDPALLLADKGRAFAVANAAARAGADEISPEARRQDRLELDPSAAEGAASRYLRDAGWSGTVTADANRVAVEVERFHANRLMRVFGFDGKRVRAVGSAEPVEGAGREEP